MKRRRLEICVECRQAKPTPQETIPPGRVDDTDCSLGWIQQSCHRNPTRLPDNLGRYATHGRLHDRLGIVRSGVVVGCVSMTGRSTLGSCPAPRSGWVVPRSARLARATAQVWHRAVATNLPVCRSRGRNEVVVVEVLCLAGWKPTPQPGAEREWSSGEGKTRGGHFALTTAVSRGDAGLIHRTSFPGRGSDAP